MASGPIATYYHTYAAASGISDPVEAVMSVCGWWAPDSTDMSSVRGEETTLLLTSGVVAADRNDVFTVMLSKIPAEVTRVLDIGCGNGDFAKVLHATRPGVNYRGIDLSMEAIAVATSNLEVGGSLPGNVELAVGNATEYLLEATEDWDFIISSRCLFEETRRPGDRDLLRLVDSKAAKGWFMYGMYKRLIRPDLQAVMQEALASSTAAVEHYFKDADPEVPQTFLTGHSTTGSYPCHPAYIARGGTLMAVPDAQKFDRYAKVKNGKYEAERARATIRFDKDMTDYKGIVTDGNGLITGEAIVLKANAPVNADLDNFALKQAEFQNQIKADADF
jgi:SAM-dependent methyltransferase